MPPPTSAPASRATSRASRGPSSARASMAEVYGFAPHWGAAPRSRGGGRRRGSSRRGSGTASGRTSADADLWAQQAATPADGGREPYSRKATPRARFPALELDGVARSGRDSAESGDGRAYDGPVVHVARRPKPRQPATRPQTDGSRVPVWARPTAASLAHRVDAPSGAAPGTGEWDSGSGPRAPKGKAKSRGGARGGRRVRNPREQERRLSADDSVHLSGRALRGSAVRSTLAMAAVWWWRWLWWCVCVCVSSCCDSCRDWLATAPSLSCLATPATPVVQVLLPQASLDHRRRPE